MTNYLTQVKQTLDDNRRWLVIAVAVFLLGLFFAWGLTILAPEETMGLFEDIFLELESLGKRVFNESTAVQGFTTLFLNNWRAATLMMALGPLLGLFPLIGLLINGSLVGVIVGLMSDRPLILMVSILPHGIIELPAIFISAAFGMKLGWCWLRKPPSPSTRGSVFRSNLSTIVRFIWPLVTILLILSAIIEVTVTPYLLTFLL